MDINSLTTATLIELEQHTGLSLGEVLAQAQNLDVADGQLPPALVLGGLCFIAARADDPAISWDAAINRPLGDLDALVGDASPEA